MVTHDTQLRREGMRNEPVLSFCLVYQAFRQQSGAVERKVQIKWAHVLSRQAGAVGKKSWCTVPPQKFAPVASPLTSPHAHQNEKT